MKIKLEMLSTASQVIIRLVIAIIFLLSGIQKIQNPSTIIESLQSMNFPFAEFQGWLVILSEIICGLLLFLGLFLRFSVIPLAIIMIVGIFTVHIKNGLNTNTWFTILLFLQLINIGYSKSQLLTLDGYFKHKK